MSEMVCLYCMKLIESRGGKKHYRVCGRCRGRAIISLSKMVRAVAELNAYLQKNKFNSVKSITSLLKSSPTVEKIIHPRHFHRGIDILINMVNVSKGYEETLTIEEYLIVYLHRRRRSNAP